jgi:hypothetical protein
VASLIDVDGTSCVDIVSFVDEARIVEVANFIHVVVTVDVGVGRPLVLGKEERRNRRKVKSDWYVMVIIYHLAKLVHRSRDRTNPSTTSGGIKSFWL